MRRYIVLLLVLVMLLAACGTAHPSDNTSNPTRTEQNGIEPTEGVTSDPTKETTPTDPTGDSSGTGTADATTETGNTQGFTDETTKPTQDSTVPGDYTLSLSRKSLSLEIGQIGAVSVTYTGTGTLHWMSNDESVATVSNGKITAKKDGTAVITVTDGVKSASCVVTVTKKTETPVEVTLKLSKGSLDLKTGDVYTLNVTYNGSKSLSWNTTNSAIVAVSNGKVTAKAAGTAYVNVTDGVYTATCKVVVTNKEKPVEVKISVNPTSLNLVVGNTSTLTASYNGTGTLSWNTSNSSVAVVSNGTVTAKGVGTATISVTDGSKTATCQVSVTAPAATVTLKITTKNGTTINVGDTLQIEYTYTGNKALTWSSDTPSVLTVDNNGKVTAKSAGAAGIVVSDGTLEKAILINVEANKPKATSIEMDSFNAPLHDGVTKYAGDYMSFRAWTLPYESNRNMTVTSNNSSVVSVSSYVENNKHYITLNFKSAGNATVTLKSADGAVTKSYSITVKSGYSCNPGSGQLTPEQFVNAYNGVSKANGMSISGMPTGYLVLTLSESELTWARAKREAEGGFHAWWKIGYRTMVLTYEGTNGDGNHVFYVRGH